MGFLSRNRSQQTFSVIMFLGTLLLCHGAFKCYKRIRKERQRHNQPAYHPTQCDLHTHLLHVLDILKSEITSTQAEILLSQTLPLVYADPCLIHQLFLHMISNALKFGKQSKTPHIILHTERVDGYVRVFVQNNGNRIPAKCLATCKEIVEQLGGHFSTITSETLGSILMVDLLASVEAAT